MEPRIERQPLLGSGPPVAVNPRASALRFWILFVSGCICVLQGFVWNTFGPISNVLLPVFGWNDQTIALLANWGGICYTLAFLPTAWLLARSVRLTVVLASGLMWLSCVLRLCSLHPPAVTPLTHVSAFINGLGGPVGLVLGPVVAALWFPLQERVTATAVSGMANYIGVALSFVVGPALVPNRPGTLLPTDIEALRQHYNKYMWVQAGFASFVFLAVVVCFPNRPMNAPTLSAAEDRLGFYKGLRQLAGNGNFWLISAAQLTVGIFSAWSGYLLPNMRHFRPADRVESEAGWLGFYSTLAGCFAAVLMSLVADRLRGHLKFMLLLFALVSAGAALWFALMCINIAPRRIDMIYVALVLTGAAVNGAIPLQFEAAVEATYPVAEGTTTSIMTSLVNFGFLLFLIFPEIPGLGHLWMNWTLAGSCAVGFLVLLLYRQQYRRLSVDSLRIVDQAQLHSALN